MLHGSRPHQPLSLRCTGTQAYGQILVSKPAPAPPQPYIVPTINAFLYTSSPGTILGPATDPRNVQLTSASLGGGYVDNPSGNSEQGTYYVSRPQAPVAVGCSGTSCSWIVAANEWDGKMKMVMVVVTIQQDPHAGFAAYAQATGAAMISNDLDVPTSMNPTVYLQTFQNGEVEPVATCPTCDGYGVVGLQAQISQPSSTITIPGFITKRAQGPFAETGARLGPATSASDVQLTSAALAGDDVDGGLSDRLGMATTPLLITCGPDNDSGTYCIWLAWAIEVDGRMKAVSLKVLLFPEADGQGMAAYVFADQAAFVHTPPARLSASAYWSAFYNGESQDVANCLTCSGYGVVGLQAHISYVNAASQAQSSAPPFVWEYAALPTNVPINSGLNCHGRTAGRCPVPGLNSIASDVSGRWVWAVGAPAEMVSSPGSVFQSPFTPVTGAGIILHSGDSGTTFKVQAAPQIAGQYYTLNSVLVLRSAIAIAGGGSPIYYNIPSPTSPSTGVLIATLNGGLSWSALVRSLPS